MARIELGVFDIDGTIRIGEGIPEIVVEGFRRLREREILTTVLTGRGTIRAQEILAGDYETIVSSGSPVGVENGGRITDSDGRQNIRYFPLHYDEIDAVLSNLSQGEIEFLAYYPEHGSRALIWTPDSERAAILAQKYGHFAEIESSATDKLGSRLQEDNPCMLVIKPFSLDFVAELPSGLNTVVNEGEINVNRANIDKGKGVIEISDLLNIDLSRVLVAGNDRNDIPMLEQSVGKRVIVGSKISGYLSVPDLIQVDTVEDLGGFISSLQHRD